MAWTGVFTDVPPYFVQALTLFVIFIMCPMTTYNKSLSKLQINQLPNIAQQNTANLSEPNFSQFPGCSSYLSWSYIGVDCIARVLVLCRCGLSCPVIVHSLGKQIDFLTWRKHCLKKEQAKPLRPRFFQYVLLIKASHQFSPESRSRQMGKQQNPMAMFSVYQSRRGSKYPSTQCDLPKH